MIFKYVLQLNFKICVKFSRTFWEGFSSTASSGDWPPWQWSPPAYPGPASHRTPAAAYGRRFPAVPGTSTPAPYSQNCKQKFNFLFIATLSHLSSVKEKPKLTKLINKTKTNQTKRNSIKYSKGFEMSKSAPQLLHGPELVPPRYFPFY